MDKDNNDILSQEYAYVDAKHDRCRGFKTITLWTYHPTLRKLVNLAIVETEEENTENFVLFWNTFNEMLADFLKVPSYKFNPAGFVCDEHHANWNSLQTVFTSDVLKRIVSCEFHFKQSLYRHSKKLSFNADEFIRKGNGLLAALTVTDFETACADMTALINKEPHLESWFQWWFERRTHIFRAYKNSDAPRSNLAEVGHAKMASVGRQYMSLLEAAAIAQETNIELFSQGVSSGGKGRACTEMLARQRKQEIKRAHAYGRELEARTQQSVVYQLLCQLLAVIDHQMQSAAIFQVITTFT